MKLKRTTDCMQKHFNDDLILLPYDVKLLLFWNLHKIWISVWLPGDISLNKYFKDCIPSTTGYPIAKEHKKKYFSWIVCGVNSLLKMHWIFLFFSYS